MRPVVQEPTNEQIQKDKRADLKRRASQQATYGNYWAGKCVALLNIIEQMEVEVVDLTDEAVLDCSIDTNS